MTFQVQMFGSFRQSVVFDFGQGRLLQKKLVVDVGTRERYQEIRTERMQMQLQRWDGKNADIVYCDATIEQLVAKYPIPDTDELADLSCMENVSLTEENYVQQKHRMLYLEEHTCIKHLSRYGAIQMLLLLLCPGMQSPCFFCETPTLTLENLGLRL